MISVIILYPKSDGSTFDMDYYTSKHMPMFAEALGDACGGWGVQASHGDDYHCIAWATVSSMEAFGAAMQAHGAAVLGDVPNYTNTQPQLVTGDVVV